MAPSRNTTTASTRTQPPLPTKEETDNAELRELCIGTKRFVFGIVNFIALVITCVYISHAYQHYQVIEAHPDTLKNPYGGLDLSYEKIGYIFAIGRVIILSFTILSILSVPEWFIFLWSLVLLIFEIPMACVAQSNFGYLVNFGQLDLSPPSVGCTNTTMTETQWAFYSDYGAIAGRLPGDVCLDFVHEGSVLRASLLFSWFTTWIVLFLVAFITALAMNNRRWSDFFMYLTGINLQFSWAGIKKALTPKVKFPGLRRRASTTSTGSDTTLETVTVDAAEKV